eukprot:m.192029 g.192029  ORF g.192029 m.192029 type:complete len:370 (-) comp10053_c0_seq14:219-1328(-)
MRGASWNPRSSCLWICARCRNLRAIFWSPSSMFSTTLLTSGHFKWAVTRATYDDVIAPSWPDVTSDTLRSVGLSEATPEGPWYTTMDAILTTMEGPGYVLYPEVPRAAISPNIPEVKPPAYYGDYIYNMRLYDGPLLEPAELGLLGGRGGLDGANMNYDAALEAYATTAIITSCIHDIGIAHRHGNLVLLASPADDLDPAWDVLLENHLGVQGRDVGRARPSGIYHGTVLTRWRTNLVLIVAPYSPLAAVPRLADAAAAPRTACRVPSDSDYATQMAALSLKPVVAPPNTACAVACLGECDAGVMFLANACAGTCGLCVEERAVQWAPASSNDGKTCHRAAFERHLSCTALPPAGHRRVCVCPGQASQG